MTDPHDILTVGQSYEADRRAAELGVPTFTLMQTAGAAVARAVSSRWSKRPVAVLCGPGMNGGDGYVAAKLLAGQGWPVRVLASALPQGGDALRALEDWGGTAHPLCGTAEALGDAGLVIDALYGAGLSRPLPDPETTILKAAEAAGIPIIAVDLPSGVSGDAAEPLGYAPHAALTVTFHRKKPAHVLEPASVLCGEVVVADIGMPDGATPATTLRQNHPDLWRDLYPWPKRGTHKHARGRLGVVGGPRHQTGAARLSVRAGLRIAGTVRLYCEPAAADIYAAALEAAMLKPVRSVEELGELAREMDAFVIGPSAGVTPETRSRVETLAQAGVALCLDADALTVFKDDTDALFTLLDDRDVLTPHPGEFERLWPGLLKSSPTRIDAAREAARRAGCVVLLKGGDTVIAAPDDRAVVNTHATPWLATAGSGDVLAGIIGGLLSGGTPAFEAACCGAWVHGDAGLRFGPGLTAEDLPELLSVVIGELAA
jgi:hydroxyethylthiazole kinase-like uncharacterized protein yjeF